PDKPKANPLFFPEFIVMLSADDSLLEKRLIALDAQEGHNTEDGFKRRLAFYKQNNNLDDMDNNLFAFAEEVIMTTDEQALQREITVQPQNSV
ncbi:hypothetical protein OFC37_29720, partial [Escherichia coli]|nr:hypothetical protein [Escherichia coli]